MVGVILTLSLLANPDFRVGVDKQVAGVFGWVTNYAEVMSGQSYEAQLVPHIFKHTWTLAIEMHYYVIWVGIIALFVYFQTKNKTKTKNKTEKLSLSTLKKQLALTAIIIAVLSYVCMWIMSADNTDSNALTLAYYSTQSRAFPLMLGSLTALFFGYDLNSRIDKLSKSTLFTVIAVITTTVLFVVMFVFARNFRFSELATYRFGMLSISLMCCCIIALFRMLQEHRYLPEPKIFSYISSRSYGVYLFHWGLYCMREDFFGKGHSPKFYAIAVIVASFIFAEISHRLTEMYIHMQKKKYPLMLKGAICGILGVLTVFSVKAVVTAPPIDSQTKTLSENKRFLTIINIESTIQAKMSESIPPTDTDPINPETTDPTNTNPADPARTAPVTTDNSKKTTPITTTFVYEPKPEPEPEYYIVNDEERGKTLHIPEGGLSMFGDSVALGAALIIHEKIPGFVSDCEEGRKMKDGIDIIVNQLMPKNKLGKTVVLAMSNNVYEGGDSKNSLDTFLDSLEGKGYRVVIATGYDPDKPDTKYNGKDPINPNNFSDYIRSLPKKYKFVAVADWGKIVKANPDYVYGIHFPSAYCDGTSIYADTIIDAIVKVQEQEAS
jgi:peptidoglycan/LPS O-acetylase OafA/YrhL